MQTTIQKCGNGLAIRIPKAIAAKARLEEDTIVEMSLVNGQIVVWPVPTRTWTLKELLRGITKHNRHREFDTGIAVGKER